MTAMEFLNILCYTIDKAEHDKASWSGGGGHTDSDNVTLLTP